MTDKKNVTEDTEEIKALLKFKYKVDYLIKVNPSWDELVCAWIECEKELGHKL